MVFLNSECKYFFALMRLTDGFLSISQSFQTQMRQKPFFSYILSTYQHILILSCRQFLRFSLFSACAISDKEVPMKKEKHSDIPSRKNPIRRSSIPTIICLMQHLRRTAPVWSLSVPQTELSWNPTKKSIIIGRRKLIRRNVSDFYQPNKERFRSFCPKPFLIFTLVTTTITWKSIEHPLSHFLQKSSR